MTDLKLKGRKLYRPDGSVFAEVYGCRPVRGNSQGFAVSFDAGDKERGYVYFKDAVQAARNRWRDAGDLPVVA